MRRQGFTLVEVLVSLGVMTIGAMALIGMQGQTSRANGRARDMTTATQIAQNVIERLKMDGLAWTDLNNISATKFLNAIDSGTPGQFKTFTAVPFARRGENVTVSNAFDQTGLDVPLVGADAALLATVKYCTSYRLTWIYTSRRALRADVRVWWTKEVPTRAILSDFAGCADDHVRLSPGGTLYDSYHVVYLSTVIRPHPL